MIIQGTELQGYERELCELLAQKDGWKDGYVVTRPNSNGALYELQVEGENESGSFRYDLVLKAIKVLVPWTTKTVAAMTDHPGMVVVGDWSGIRDSSHEKIRAIFDKYVLPQLNPPIQRMPHSYTGKWLNDEVKKIMKEIKKRNKKASLYDWAIIIDAHGRVTLNVSYFTGDGTWQEAHSTAL